MKLCFLLAKDPTSEAVGDTAMMNQLLRLVREDHDVSIICWSQRPELGVGAGIVRLPKPAVAPARIAGRALLRGRSLLHSRFDDPAMRAAVDATDADAYVAVHHYLAEPFFHSSRREAPLYVVNVVPEGPVWRETRGRLGRLQGRTIERDEDRVLRRAVSVGSYDRADAEDATVRGARRSVWLQLTQRPQTAADVRSTAPRLAVLGDRTWAPNDRSWRRMLALWPEISVGIPEAQLVGIGRPAGIAESLPPGVVDLGFVDDLHAVLRTCRALAAPLDIGGGVRVKLLEAASLGLPVVATTTATGSLGGLLGIEPVDDDVQFIAACRRLLTAPEFAADQGAQLHAANVAHWESGRPEDSVHAWLA